MKRQSTRYNESSSFSNNLMKRESFRATRGMGENDFRRGLKGSGNFVSDSETKFWI